MHDLVFMVDFDNTVLDNDGVKSDMDAALRAMLGDDLTDRCWQIYETVRDETGIVDVIETLRRLRADTGGQESRIDEATRALMAWDFRPRLYPRALDALRHLARLGLTLIASDGDPVFQPAKIQQSGATAAVDGRVFIFAHKEPHLDALMTRYAARRHVLIDDKPGILMRAKQLYGPRLVTVQVRQGKYALDPALAVDVDPDIALPVIEDALRLTAENLLRIPSRAAR